MQKYHRITATHVVVMDIDVIGLNGLAGSLFGEFGCSRHVPLLLAWMDRHWPYCTPQ